MRRSRSCRRVIVTVLFGTIRPSTTSTTLTRVIANVRVCVVPATPRSTSLRKQVGMSLNCDQAWFPQRRHLSSPFNRTPDVGPRCARREPRTNGRARPRESGSYRPRARECRGIFCNRTRTRAGQQPSREGLPCAGTLRRRQTPDHREARWRREPRGFASGRRLAPFAITRRLVRCSGSSGDGRTPIAHRLIYLRGVFRSSSRSFVRASAGSSVADDRSSAIARRSCAIAAATSPFAA